MAARTTLPGSNGTDDTAGQPLHKAGIDRLPGGLAAYSISTTPVDVTALATIDDVTFTALASRSYLVVVSYQFKSTGASDGITYEITDGSNAILRSTSVQLGSANVTYAAEFSFLDISVTGGSMTYRARAVGGGGGTVTACPSNVQGYIAAYDVSPQF